MARAIKEAVYIRVNNPTLIENTEKYNLPHIWDQVLHSIPELKTKQTKKLIKRNINDLSFTTSELT